ncbi:MAG: YgiQ family radical SAM protein [Rikenellaceae bacterium]|jgi:uncharacterized radical SAM protein YgiQ|nr:YgiQ family radical SAM protein [Rikenellaceae bacterium]
MPFHHISDWLPTTAKEVEALGWDQPDVILFTGDAYVDHPSFGVPVIGRVLQAEGYKVAIVPQPNWRDDLRDFKKLGKPRLFFGVSAGNMDSMVNHYTANLRLRSDDAYTPGDRAGFRPDYAATRYAQILKRLFPDVPVVLGGIEASLRRLTHYDYWSNTIKPSILIESGADIVSYGLGERAIVDIAKALHNGFNMNLLRKLPQVAFVADAKYAERIAPQAIRLHSHEACAADPVKFGEKFVQIETESNKWQARTLIEPVGERFVVVNAPYPPQSTGELDRTYALPFTRLPHPRYKGKGAIPAYEMIRWSVNLHRGCFGGCSFCTISAHQGKFIASRSVQSILSEVETLTAMEGFKGVLTDLGGPSANMYGLSGKDPQACRLCARASCLWPKPCPNLRRDHRPLIDLYRRVRRVKGVKQAFIGSGIRYDLFLDNPDQSYLREVVTHHVGGRLKVAPEHTEAHVLGLMRKPDFGGYVRLQESFREICRQQGLNFQLIPYFISSHPGCTQRDMAQLAEKTGRMHLHLEQVQDFTPTPMTLSSVMYATGLNPYTGEKLFVARGQEEKKKQKSYFFKR